MEQPFITALIPTGNRQHLIPLAISCALSQTYPNFEILIVDDGIVPTKITIKDSRLRYIGPSELSPWPEWTLRLPLGAKINESIAFAKGEIIMHFDDDDWYAPGRMQDQVDLLLSSGKHVTGYNDFFIWPMHFKPPVLPYRQTTPNLCTGATQAYYLSWWETHKFEETKTGFDCVFSNTARKENQLALKSGIDMFVARQHGHNSWVPTLGAWKWPKGRLDELPVAFLETTK
jgi:hypothetical protein